MNPEKSRLSLLPAILVFLLPFAVIPGMTAAFELPKQALLVIAAGILTAAELLFHHRLPFAKFHRLMPAIPLLALLVAFIPAGLTTPSRIVCWQLLLTAAHIVLFAAIASGEVLRQTKRTLNALLAAGIILSVYGILQRLGIDPLMQHLFHGMLPRHYVAGTFGNPLHLSAFLAPLPLLALHRCLSPKKNPELLPPIALALCTAGILVTECRSAIIGLLAGLTLYGFISTGNRRFHTRLASAVLASLLLALVLILPGWQQRWQDSPETFHLRKGDRLLEWHVAVSLFRKHPLFGWGPKGYGIQYLEMENRLLMDDRFDYRNGHQRAERAHNDLLELAAQHGMAGLFAAFFLLAATLKLMIACRNRAQPERSAAGVCTAALLCIGTVSLVSFPFHIIPVSAMAAALLGCISACHRPPSDHWTPPKQTTAILALIIIVITASVALRLVAADRFAGTSIALLETASRIPRTRREMLLNRASEQAKLAVRWNPDHGQAHTTLASLLLMQGQTEAAIKELQIARQTFRDSRQDLFLGMAFQRLHQPEEAVKWFDRLLRHGQPKSLMDRTAFHDGRSYMDLGLRLAALDRLSLVSPDSPYFDRAQRCMIKVLGNMKPSDFTYSEALLPPAFRP